ncbi:ABC transporter ATP-binding protein [Enterococcus sp. ALS3]|uniref:ABC transporter ATP-binding protein n=1 Tax=Enterococcus alishanensis TaxID=1303817 RepID=A0ABS6TC45_9ENTE|nr:ABC transporter ATP-binding protein [Enterococcus alishanensis]MBV7390483.1 ABC transporter ATP-binding protein [Enterococcus alishanensis]
MGKTIELRKIGKKYGDQTILQEIDLAVAAGERIVLLGPSGSGKSTLLRMIAGLEKITSGELFLGTQAANQMPCGEREIAMVFQNYALYPHMTVSENITFALKANKLKAADIQLRLEEALDMLGLTPYKDRLPKDLSGGQRQRVALARAVVKRSDYFLLDEPLSNLDVRLRLDARKELVKIHQRYQQTFVYVTHDQIEAMTLADRIVLLNEGKIQMVDTPQNVYAKPSNTFTANFIGSPGMNVLEVTYDQGTIKFANQFLPLNPAWQKKLANVNGAVYLGIRPEHLSFTKETSQLKGQIKYRELLGQSYAYTVQVGVLEMIVLDERPDWQIGDNVNLALKEEKIHFFDYRTTENLGYPNYLTEEGGNIHALFASI